MGVENLWLPGRLRPLFARIPALAGLSGLMAADWGQAWRLPGAVYHEFRDQMATATYATVTGTDLADSGEPRASIAFRETSARGWVFSIGATSVGSVLAIDPVLQRIATNALDAAIAGNAR